jgi:hypothetical protein
MRICGGTTVTKCFFITEERPQCNLTCSISDWDLYWTRRYIEYMCELIRLLKTKSTIRYLPPKGTDGFERKAVRGKSLSPFPPASTNARVFGYAIIPPVKLCLIMNLQKNRLFYCMELSKAIFSSTYLMHDLVNTEDIIFSLILIRPPKAD